MSKCPILTYPIGKTSLGSFLLKVFKNRTYFLKLIRIGFVGHQQQIPIILVPFVKQIVEYFVFQIEVLDAPLYSISSAL